MSILAIIPARSGSKGIPGKNLALCAGKELVRWSIDACLESQLLTNTVVSTDFPDITSLAGRGYTIATCGEISDEAQIEDRLAPIIEAYGASIIVLLQPTSPVRTGKQIDEAIEQLQREGADSLLSVVESHAFIWRSITNPAGNTAITSYDYKKRPRRQDHSPELEENGSIYCWTREHWERTKNRLGGLISLYVMPPECRTQVDDEMDLFLVEKILERQACLTT
jgi:CMP-N,N'-diacetyllegionaminic acid synthase